MAYYVDNSQITIKSLKMKVIRAQKIIQRLPLIKPLFAKIERYEGELTSYRKTFPPGHFYSPIPSIDEVKLHEASIYPAFPQSLPGIELHTNEQLTLLKKMKKYMKNLPFKDVKNPGTRYYYKNEQFGHGDAVALIAMMRMFLPKRIIEVGSGFSSALMIDVNERFFKNNIDITLIEPYTERLDSLLRKSDYKKVVIHRQNIQEVDTSIFKELKANDFLFIDSTHISKVNSDVNKLIFDVLPLLKKGVIIHIHDVFYPFEYPKEWIYQGIFFNEDYLLRAFLAYNKTFKIILFSDYLWKMHEKELIHNLPLYAKMGGGSLWLKKVT